MTIDDRLYMVRNYFEIWCWKHDVEVDTARCDEYIGTMYQIIEESKDVNWDADFDSFYDFMVENLV